MKKIFFLSIIFLSLLSSCSHSEIIKIPIINCKMIEATAYNNTRRQCDSTPNEMAWGDMITKKNRNKIVAISRDLLSYLPRKSKIYYEHNDKIHKKSVLDKMGRYGRKGTGRRFKIKNSIDILMSSRRRALNFGRRKKMIYWLDSYIELKNFDLPQVDSKMSIDIKNKIICINKLENNKLKIVERIIKENGLNSSFVIIKNL